MEVLKFLEGYKDNLQEGLVELKKQFNVDHKVYNGKLLLKYHTQSNKTLKVVRECRGLILSVSDLKVISCPFEKFGNHGEAYAPTDLDMTKCKVVEKLDGTCIGMYYDQLNGKWCVQTLKQVEAEETIKAFSRDQSSNFTWSGFFWNMFKRYTDLSILDTLDKNYTYMFEMCSIWNKVVITHKEPKLVFTGLRNKVTFKEEWPENCVLYNIFDKPKVYEYKDINEIVKIASEVLDANDEGFILVDENFRRVKIKSKAYVEQHYRSTVITINNVVGIVIENEQDEWLISFPEYTDIVEIIKDEINILGKKIDDFYAKMSAQLKYKDNAKELALLLKKELKGENGIERAYVFQLQRGAIQNGVEGLTSYTRPEEIVRKTRMLLENTNICSRAEFNINNGSLRG